MNASRPPTAPPDLPGFIYRELLGSGGFADVFLYDQALPQRRVAVKVLLADRLSHTSIEDFAAEANIMAQLSTHPAIVTIYQAGVSDDGRPYLVMEYCSRPNLQARYRREPFSVAESLRVGVQVAAAVETAHRAGILHRDIKPANILVTEYNRPALTDFGISTAGDTQQELAGMSIPWSPPEAFAEAGSPGRSGDVYALGATVYTLLAGRSPFEIPGERNGSAELIQRVLTMPVPPLGRADAPASLQRALERAMATAPGDRYASALDFARALQRVQLELNMAATPIDVIDESVDDSPIEDQDGGLTRIRGIVSIDPSLPPPIVRAPGSTTPLAGTTAPPSATTVGATVMRPGPGQLPAWDSAPPDATVQRSAPLGARSPAQPAPAFAAAPPAQSPPTTPDPAESTEDPPSPPRRRMGAVVGAIVAAVVVLGGGGIALAAATGLLAPAPQPSSEPEEQDAPVDILPTGGVPAVADLEGTVQGDSVTFSWRNTEPEEGDTYLWAVQRLGEDTRMESTDQPTITVPAEPGGRTCVEVTLVRADRQSSPLAEACAP